MEIRSRDGATFYLDVDRLIGSDVRDYPDGALYRLFVYLVDLRKFFFDGFWAGILPVYSTALPAGVAYGHFVVTVRNDTLHVMCREFGGEALERIRRWCDGSQARQLGLLAGAA